MAVSKWKPQDRVKFIEKQIKKLNDNVWLSAIEHAVLMRKAEIPLQKAFSKKLMEEVKTESAWNMLKGKTWKQ